MSGMMSQLPLQYLWPWSSVCLKTSTQRRRRLRGFQIELTALTTLLEHRAPHFVDAGEGAVREALPLVVCKWFLNLFVDALPFPALLAVWDLLLTDPMLLDTTPPTSGGTLMDSAKYPEMAASHETPPRAGSPTVSSPTIPTDGLLRVTLALISAHEGAILAALGSTGCPDASVAYSSLLDISNDAVNPADLIGAAKEISLEPATVFTLRNMARASLEEADAAEAILRGGVVKRLRRQRACVSNSICSSSKS